MVAQRQPLPNANLMVEFAGKSFSEWSGGLWRRMRKRRERLEPQRQRSCAIQNRQRQRRPRQDRLSLRGRTTRRSKPFNPDDLLPKYGHMASKLSLSQEILNGLVTEDHELIEKRGRAMLVLTLARNGRSATTLRTSSTVKNSPGSSSRSLLRGKRRIWMRHRWGPCS